MEKYVYIKESISVHKSQDEILLIVEDKNNRKGERLYNINEDALNIIKKFNGDYKLKEIIEQLSIFYNETFDDIKSKLIKFLKLMENNYNLNIGYSINNMHKEIEIKNNQNPYLPRVISIELTHKCNFKCLHCYGEYDNENSEMMDFNKLKKFLIQAKDLGVESIELTGGEITMHPDICEILNLIHKLEFKLVSLLTNGFIRNDELYNLIIQHKENTFVQIDMHGNTENYLKWFTQVPNTKEKVEENIKYLHDNGVYIRVVTTVTPHNLNQIEDIADWVHSLGIRCYGVSTVIPTGRANDDSKNLIINSIEEFNKLQEILYNISQKYGKKFLNLIEDDNSLNSNCGALISNPSISPNGDLKICAMDDLNITKSIGNVLEENIKDIYENNLEFIKSFKNLKSPSLDMKECKDCENIDFCLGCVLRGTLKGIEKGDECLWLKDIVPIEIKEKLIKNPVLA
ncbi:radical SAM/SPASM domain-containing protein [Paraclostridium bifermentans]|uniref:radical SAM/SPASM domain-containing protein n=1 Tax=Paraclostridium bifermentans TaxID=1490 RepID=UPI00387B8715